MAPDSVETVQDPPPLGGTTYPPGTYTRLQWTIDDLAPGGETVARYAAGVPLQANAAWTGTAPDPESGEQSANLDNNTGASTREGATEQGATNTASVTGRYDGPVAPGTPAEGTISTTATVSLEDLRMRKSVDPTGFTAGEVADYTVVIDASEYASASGIVVTDTLPYGLCPLAGPGTNYGPGSPSACDGSVATVPSSPYESVTQNDDGTFTVVFAPLDVPASGSLTIGYSARMLNRYLGGPIDGEPTSVGDSFTNRVALIATTTPIDDTGESGEATVLDDSSATLTSGGASIDKTVLPRSQSGGTCSTDAADYGAPGDFAPGETAFREGDRACFALRVDFSGATQTRNARAADFLPDGFTVVAGSLTATSANDVPYDVASDGPSSVVLDLGVDAPGGRYVLQGAVLEVVFQAEVVAAAPGPAAETRQNLLKLSFEDTLGQSTSYRDNVPLVLLPPPPLSVVKGVEAVDDPGNGPNGPGSNVDGVEVIGGSVATFRIDVTHAGTAGAADSTPVGGLDIWDVLPAGLDCSAVSDVRVDPGVASAPTTACTDPGDPAHPTFSGSEALSLLRVTWSLTGDDAAEEIAPSESVGILYDLTIPDPAGVSTLYADTAHVRSYQQGTNVADTVTTLFPQENVDSTVPADQQTAPVARDDSSVRVRGPVVAKAATSSVTETNNDGGGQATIGESLTYRYSVTVPARSEIYEGLLGDSLPAGIVIDAPPPVLEFHPDAAAPATAPAPAGVTLVPDTGQVDFGAVYANDTDLDQRFEVVLTTRVTGDALTTAENAVGRQNAARFESLENPGGSPLPGVVATFTANIRQPLPSLTKVSDATAPVPGGSVVTYTLTARNQNADGTSTNRPPLHDAFVVDCLPAGLTFQAYGPDAGQPPVPGDGSNGCPAGSTRLVWPLEDVAPGEQVVLTYTASLPEDSVAGTVYTNTAQLTGSSLDDAKTDPLAPDNPVERTYDATAATTVTVRGAGLQKAVTPGAATIGERLTWTVTTGALQDTVFYDASVIDRIPAGIDDVRLESIRCVILGTPGGSCGDGGGTVLPAVPQPDGSTLYGFLRGDVEASDDARILIVRYSGRIADDAVNVAGRAVTNTAHAAWNTSDGRTPTDAAFTFDREGEPGTATATVLEPDASIAKVVSDPTPDVTDRFTYSLTLANASGPTVSSAYDGVVVDEVPVGVVVDPGSVTSGGELAGADPVTGGGTITWDAADLPGPLAPGQTQVLRYSATLAPSADLGAAALVNTATLESYEGLPSGGRVYDQGLEASASVTPQFPRLEASKTAVDPSPAYIGEPFTWRVTITNTGGARAFGVDVTDTLPPGWRYVAGTATVVVAGGGPQQTEPRGALRLLRWTDVGSIGPGESVVVTFHAAAGETVVDDPGVGSQTAHVNTATGDGVDESGAAGNADGPYAGPAATAQTRIDSADLEVVKTHTDPVVAGSEAMWQVEVNNNGVDAAVGPFTVADTLPAGVSLVSATGEGWSCAVDGSEIECTRLAAAESLASGDSLPVIAVLVDVPADTASGTELTNTASVEGRTYDPEPDNDTDSDTATVSTEADLAVTKAHALDPVAGDRVTWTVDVVNDGPSVGAPDTVVTDTLPDDVAFVSATGDGWSCGAAGQVVTCTRTTTLPLGAAPQITVVADVDSGATGTIVNTAEVSGGTLDPDLSNNTDADPTTLVTSADLSIEKTHRGPFVAGAEGIYDLVVSNAGPSDAAPTVRITDTLPGGLTYAGSTDLEGAWACSADGQDLTCDLGGGLAAGEQASVRVRVDIDEDQGTDPITNTAEVASPTPDPNLSNNTDDDDTGVDALVDLRMTKSHDGTAVAGETFPWTLLVTNAGPSSTPGTITVTDAVPEGTTYVSATGDGWDCTESDALVTCLREDALASGEDAPLITLTVRVLPSSGPGTIVNTADVSGSRPDPLPGNNTDVDSAPVVDDVDIAVTKETVGDGVVTAGETVAFDVAVTNNGPSDADRVVVRDTLPPGTTAVSVTPPSGEGWSCTATGRAVLCTLPTLAATTPPEDPTTSVIRVVARVAPSVPAGTVLTNTVSVSTTTPGDDPADNTASSEVEVAASTDLMLIKTHEGRGPAQAGATATFTIAVANDGPSDAQGTLTVTDTLPVGLAFVSSAAPWACTPDAADPQLVQCEDSTGSALAAGGAARPLVMTVAIAAGAAPGTYTNTATVTSPTPDPDTDNNTDTDRLPVVAVADLSVTKSHTGTAQVGDDLTFTVGVANAGPSQASQVVVTDDLPAGLTYVSATGDGWSCAAAEQVVTCALADPLAPGTGAGDLTLVVTVGPEAFPVVRNTATVDARTPDTDESDNSATDAVRVPAQVDLQIQKSHQGDLTVGQDATWTLDVTNAGPTADPGPVTIVDALPQELGFVSATGTGWSCGEAGSVVTCTSRVGIPVGGTRAISLVTSVEPSAYPQVVNTAAVSSPAEDLDPENNSATDPAPVAALSRLEIDKELTGQSEGSGTFTIVVTNLGPNDTTAPIVVTDSLPEGLTYVGASGGGWSCGALGATVTCQYPETVVADDSTSPLVIETTVDADPGTEVVNVATASGGQPVACPDCGDTDDASLTVPVPDPGWLAQTGAYLARMLLVGLTLLGLGTALLRVARLRRT